MTRDEAIAQLPKAYAVAIDLRDHGSTENAIAEELGVDAETVPTLLHLADAKLDRLLAP